MITALIGAILGTILGVIFATLVSRPLADDGSTFSTASGRPMTFARGPVWIVLIGR